MPTTEIPPRPAVSSPPTATSHPADLYDAEGWESAYRELHDVPELLVQLQDELSRSRQREAFWTSVVVHLTLIILVVNGPRLERYLPRRAVIAVSPNDMMRQKELTYLELPPVKAPNPSFETKPMSPASAIEQAGRAAIANRGSYGGDNGDFGLSRGSQARAQGQVDVLSDTMGVDFGPYLSRILREIRANWIRQLPESALSGLKRGKLAIEFYILRDGRTTGMALTDPSGDVALDRSAWGGITASDPFPALPNEFAGQYLKLRIRFYCNLEESELR